MSKYKKLIVGLGNPGQKYSNTRHNIGRMVVDKWVETAKAGWKAEHGIYWIAEVRHRGELVLLCKPDTYMNNSGEAVKKIMAKHQIAVCDVIAVVDEYNFDIGKIHLKFGGSDGGHNGIASLMEHLNDDGFGRLRCGIGKNFKPGDMIDYVLSEFKTEEQEGLDQMIENCIQALKHSITFTNSRACSDVNSGKIWKDEKVKKNRNLKKITVYAASSSKIEPYFFDAAKRLGKILADNHITCVYGGGRMGLMGAMADSILENKGKIIGIIPDFLNTIELGHTGLTYLHVVDSMHTRKTKLVEDTDAVIALPGGVGTLEELMEIITWKQLGFFTKPIVILNINGYYDPLLEMLHKMIAEQFLRPKHSDMWVVAKNPEEVLDLIDTAPKWNVEAIKFAQV